MKEQGAYSLKCPGYKCGEILDAEWAPVLLKPELVVMLKDQRVRHVSLLLQLIWNIFKIYRIFLICQFKQYCINNEKMLILFIASI